MLDEEVAKKQDMEEETTEQKLWRLENSLETMQTRFARLLADYNTTQAKLKQRVRFLEERGTSWFDKVRSDRQYNTNAEDRRESDVKSLKSITSDTLEVPKSTSKDGKARKKVAILTKQPTA